MFLSACPSTCLSFVFFSQVFQQWKKMSDDDKNGDVNDSAKPSTAKKERRQGRGGGFLSLFGCASARGSSSPPLSKRQVGTKSPSPGAGDNDGGGTQNDAGAAAAVDSARGFPAGVGKKPDPTVDSKYVYNMRHQSRGLALVFNFQEFSPELGLSYRHGSEKDTVNIVAALKRLQFQVYTYNNLSCEDFYSHLIEVSTAVNHSSSDAIAVVIMSHGEEGVIFTSDRAVPLSDVFEPFRQCESLVGKPKLFFLQACRGNKFDSGMEQADSGAEETEDEAFKRALDTTDGIKTIQRLPTDADFLICYSVVPGYFSWRNGAHGSWFVQKLTEVLSQTDCSSVEFMRVMTRVNRAVAYEFESHTSNPQLDRKKQVPSIVSMLTKELYFPVK